MALVMITFITTQCAHPLLYDELRTSKEFLLPYFHSLWWESVDYRCYVLRTNGLELDLCGTAVEQLARAHPHD